MATSQQAQPPRGWLPCEREHLAAADLHLAALSSAPLPGADLRRANLHEAWLRDSCLHAADLREADLHGAHLEGADLDAADLRGANLNGADLQGGRRSRRRRPGRLASIHWRPERDEPRDRPDGRARRPHPVLVSSIRPGQGRVRRPRPSTVVPCLCWAVDLAVSGLHGLAATGHSGGRLGSRQPPRGRDLPRRPAAVQDDRSRGASGPLCAMSALRGGWGLRAGVRCPRGDRERVLGMLRITWYGAEEPRNPETLALQGSQGDRRRRAAGGWAGGTHRERASEGHRARRFGHRRLSPQHRPRRWARRPQHPGDDQKQDRAGGVKRSGGRGPRPDA